jgi:HEAT repeat protein
VNACTKAEAAKIERFLGIDKDAGMEDAVKWAGSSDPDQRIFAIAVLKDIGTPSAVDYLRTRCSNDTSGLVPKHAKGALQSLGRPSAPDTIDW